MSTNSHELFRSSLSKRKTHQGTVLLLPGLLGERTMRDSVVPPLTAEGFNVMLVNHGRDAGLHRCNLERSKDVHRAACMAVAHTVDPVIHVIAHSKGGQDAVNFMEYFHRRRDEVGDMPYSIHGYGAIAAVGRNGNKPGALDVLREFAQHRDEIRQNLNGERSVLATTVKNLGRNPLLALAEAITASRADTEEALGMLRVARIFQTEVEIYGDNDRLVPAPSTRVVELYEGHHMSPVYRSDVAVYVAQTIAA